MKEEKTSAVLRAESSEQSLKGAKEQLVAKEDRHNKVTELLAESQNAGRALSERVQG